MIGRLSTASPIGSARLLFLSTSRTPRATVCSTCSFRSIACSHLPPYLQARAGVTDFCTVYQRTKARHSPCRFDFLAAKSHVARVGFAGPEAFRMLLASNKRCADSHSSGAMGVEIHAAPSSIYRKPLLRGGHRQTNATPQSGGKPTGKPEW